MKDDTKIICNKDIVNILITTLNQIDERLVEHGARVGYIMQKMLEAEGKRTRQEIMSICMTSILHDIGAFKTEEVDKLVQFDTNNTYDHSVYGYLFIKYLSPLSEFADAVLHHHTPYDKLLVSDCNHRDLAAMMNVADRIDIILLSSDTLDIERFQKNVGNTFGGEQVNLFIDANNKYNIVEKIRNGYKNELIESFSDFEAEETDIFGYLKMLIYSIEFRSPVTVTHTFSTAIIAVELASRMKLPHNQIQKIYYGAILHDIGKIKTPLNILEKSGALDAKEMNIMQQHVVVSREILHGYIEPEIVDIATRHHEKLNGAGYPDGLIGEQMTISDKIMAVADIVSALLTKRSYKESFDRGRVIEIISKMSKSGYISSEVVAVLIAQFDEISVVLSDKMQAYIGVYERVLDEYKQLSEVL